MGQNQFSNFFSVAPSCIIETNGSQNIGLRLFTPLVLDKKSVLFLKSMDMIRLSGILAKYNGIYFGSQRVFRVFMENNMKFTEIGGKFKFAGQFFF